MNTFLTRALALPVGLAALLAVAPAQDAERDPFAAPPSLAGTGAPANLGPDSALLLRGYAERADGDALALLERAGGEVLLVGRGDRVDVRFGNRMVPYRVVHLERGRVALEPLEGGVGLELR